MKKISFTLSVFLFASMLAQGQSESFFTIANAFFGRHIEAGKVNYVGVKADIKTLNYLVKSIESPITTSDRNTKKAYLINVYNILVIKNVVDHMPIKSPMDVTGFFDQKKFNVGGKSVTLNHIENKMIRPVFADARIHFALVCGAKGCPPIINKAYMATTVESQLTVQTKKAVNKASFIKTTEGEVKVSEIFKWYKEDFKPNILAFINKYRKNKIPTSYKLSYYTYNWSLNKK